jgi:hypothetical protein
MLVKNWMSNTPTRSFIFSLGFTHIKNRAVTSASRLRTFIRLYFISPPLFCHQQTPLINASKLFKVTINLLTHRHFLSYKIYKEIISETHLHLKSFFVANYILF